MTDNITTTENSGQTSFNMDKYRFKETPKGVRILIDILKYAVLVIACLIVIVPLVVVLLGSLKSTRIFWQAERLSFLRWWSWQTSRRRSCRVT